MRSIRPGILIEEHGHVELPNRTYIEAIVILERLLEVGQRHGIQAFARDIGLRLHDLPRGFGRILKKSSERLFFPGFRQQLGDEIYPIAIREGQCLSEVNRGVLELRRICGCHQHALLQSIDNFWRILERLPERRQHVINQHHHGLTFNHRLPCGADLIVIDIRLPYRFLVVQIDIRRLHEFFQIERLVLKRMSQFVRQHRLLLLRTDPVQQVHSLGLGIVVAGDLLLQQSH